MASDAVVKNVIRQIERLVLSERSDAAVVEVPTHTILMIVRDLYGSLIQEVADAD